jgi:phosphoribosylformylglycinamidine (FGAM) synthase-like amidotransferase family enzyme
VVFALTAARILKDTDKEMPLNDKSLCAACFDLQKVLITPQSEVNTFYYKIKLATYNFSVYDMGCHEGNCYVWNEEIAKIKQNRQLCFTFFKNTERKRNTESFCLF